MTSHLKELWNYREFLWILTAREIKVRYKQTALGILWTFAPFSVAALARSKPGILGSLAERYIYVPFLFFVLWFMQSVYGIESRHRSNMWIIRSMLIGMTVFLTIGHQLTLHVAVKELFL